MTPEELGRTSPVALVTGGSKGLGLALARALAARGWRLVVDARGADPLRRARDELSAETDVIAVPGDVAEPAHRRELAAAVDRLGRLDALVNNASALGPSPQPQLADYRLADLERVYAVDVLAPLALTQLLLPRLRASGGVVLNVSSDAAVEAYPGWGGYGSAKAALDQLTAVLDVEEPAVRVYAVDPGDMRTDLHQQAFPGEDISDRPEPEAAVPGLLQLLEGSLPGGRYRVADLAAGAGAGR
jgi:NAD(P)-dependent dehydrogenase (short-subunit alcohol dehydrogenase family)